MFSFNLRGAGRHPIARAGLWLCGAALAVVLAAGPEHCRRGRPRSRAPGPAGRQDPSLRDVLDRVERDYPGQVVKVEFEEDDGEFIYEIRLLQSGGGLIKMKIDARDGRVLSVKGRDIQFRGKH